MKSVLYVPQALRRLLFLSCLLTSTYFIQAQVVSFGVELNYTNNQVEIKWWAENQQDVELYEIYRSEFGKSWIHIASADGTGNFVDKYEAIDSDPMDGRNLYRFDITYTNTAKEIAGYEYIFAQEPTSFETLTILPDHVVSNLVNSLGGDVIITNMRGEAVFQGQVDPADNLASYLPSTQNGLYIINVLSHNGKVLEQKKVMILDQ